jgi:hypothetical protein
MENNWNKNAKMFGIPMAMSQKLQEEQKRPDHIHTFLLMVWELLSLEKYVKLVI